MLAVVIINELMIIYKLECTNEDGNIEDNGYFFKKEDAEICKEEHDNHPCNKKYGIIQHVVEIEVL